LLQTSHPVDSGRGIDGNKKNKTTAGLHWIMNVPLNLPKLWFKPLSFKSCLNVFSNKFKTVSEIGGTEIGKTEIWQNTKNKALPSRQRLVK